MKSTLRGLYAVTPDLEDTQALCHKVEAALAGGAAMVQYRNKTATPALRRIQASQVQSLCARHRVPFIVNDDLDLAHDLGAEGLHLGRDDGSVAAARARLGHRILLGASCYDSLERADAALAAGADYVAFGAAFPSRVKPDAVHASLDLYATASRRYPIPVVAIGGITLDNAAGLIAAGVDAVAVITAVFEAADVTRAARSFSDLFANSV